MVNRRTRTQRGNALIEFALGWSVLWLMFMGVFQFGYSFYVYNALLTQVANAAQLGSKMTYDTGNACAYTTALQNMVVYGDTASGSHPVVPGLTVNNVNVQVSTQNAIPTDVTITITGYTLDAVFTQINFSGKPQATAVYMGQIACSSC